MEWYKLVFQRYAEFDGRSRRSEYWYFVLFNFLISLSISVVSEFIFNNTFIGVTGVLYSLAVFIPSLAVTIRRLHDSGRSGWFILLPLIPVIGAIVLIVFLATDSQPGSNQWGPNPKTNANDKQTIDHLIV